MRSLLGLVAPGTELRQGLDRIVNGRTGALIVLGDTREVQELCTGGFGIDVEFSPTAVRELAKMDGAIVLSAEAGRIVRAGVQLMPEADIPTVETGTRHRTADRVSRQTGVPCLSVSASMNTIAVYDEGRRYLVQQPQPLLARASQAMQTLERYTARLHESAERLSAMEVQDQVQVRDLGLVLQRWEMVRRLQEEVSDDVVALGTDGRLLQMQLSEAVSGLDELADLLVQDYAHTAPDFSLIPLGHLTPEELLEHNDVLRAVGYPGSHVSEETIRPKGYRQLAQIRRLPASVAVRLVEHFGGLQELFGATTADLLEVDGVGEGRARMVRDGLVRLADAAYADSLD